MYKKLDELLSGYFNIDYWYDEGVIIAWELLHKFEDDDWNELLDNLLSKSVEWQTRFAYSIDKDIDNKMAVESLFILSKTDNDELFVTVIDSLRCVVEKINMSIMDNNSHIVDKIEKMIPRCGIATQKILEDFITRIY